MKDKKSKMIIIHSLDSFLVELFPQLHNNLTNQELIKNVLEEFYTYSNIRPEINITKTHIEVNINTDKILNQNALFNQANNLCENNKFNEAIPLLLDLIKQNPSNSEYYRTLGQAYSMIGDDENAVNYLIDALKWNPKNNYALIMIGNIFARNKNDIETAKKYYLQVINNNPEDFIAINNLGTNFLQNGKIEEGLEFFEKAYSINKDYPNSIYGIALANEMLGNTLIAFEFGIECLKKCKPNDLEIKKHATELVFKTARKYLQNNNGIKVFNEYKEFIEKLAKKPIQVSSDETLDTAAKMEFAENYNRDYHLVKYKPTYVGVYHLMMHEIAHLQLVIEARDVDVNMQFITNNEQFKKFKSDFSKNANDLRRTGVSELAIENYFNGVFHGINRQLFNTPIDLFIEDRLYEMYQEMRPIQFLSLFQIINEGIISVTNKEAKKITPHLIFNASKVLNMVSALHLKDLYGIDLIKEFNATPIELKQANQMFQEFFEYRDDKAAGEEYEIVKHWGDDLKLSSYFSLRKETFEPESKTIDQVINEIENDPLGLDENLNFKTDQMNKFQESQKELGLNMAVVMFMVDAMQYFNKLPKSLVKEIAFQIALIGTQGIKPDVKGYKVPLIKNKDFSGYHLLAYYYISWAISVPDMLESLHLPYDNEYEMAKTLFKQ